MEQQTTVIKKSWGMKIAKVLVGIVVVCGILFGILVIVRIPHSINKQKTAEQVAKIHATKLTLDDVMGRNLPPDPGAEADTTIAGVDANNNGIRDDVELAIFKEYPDSAKTRAAALQYAMVFQVELTQVFNSETLVAAMQEGGRASSCFYDIDGEIRASIQRKDSFEKLVLNIDARKKKYDEIYRKYMTSYGDSAIEGKPDCDIDPASLPN